MSRAQPSVTDSRDQVAALEHRGDREFDSTAFQRDPAFIEEQLPKIGRAIRAYFTPEIRGIERLPTEGPFLLVSNHSGGMLMPDAWALSSALFDYFGADRPIYPLMLDFAFKIPGFGDTLRKFGAIPANMKNAEHAVDLGAGVMVYPGGDWEAYRPWTDRNRIDLHDRSGFVKLALRRGLPVFPAVSHGSHHSVIVLNRGDRFAEMLGLKRLRVGVFPFTLGLPFVPIPTKIIVEVLDPVDWSGQPPEAAENPDTVQSCYDEITSSMQAALDRLVDEMPHPRTTRLLGATGLLDR